MEQYFIRFKTEEGNTFLIEADEGISPEEGAGEEMEKAGAVEKFAGNTIVAATTMFEEAIGSVMRYNVKALLQAIRGLPVEDQPKSMEVTFGLKATAEAGYPAVAKAGGEANYTITLTWAR